MTTNTLPDRGYVARKIAGEPGIDLHGERVRVRRMFAEPIGMHVHTFPLNEWPSAITYRDTLDELRAVPGGRPPASSGYGEHTIGGIIDAWRLGLDGAKTRKGDYKPRTLVRIDDSIKAIARYLDPSTPISKCTAPLITALHRERAKDHPKSAAEELTIIKRSLVDGEGRGIYGHDPAIHNIKRSPIPRRSRKVVTLAELRELADAAPDFAGVMSTAALLRVLGMIGLRIGEALALRDLDVIRIGNALYLRIRDNKEGNAEKKIRLTTVEARLFTNALGGPRRAGAARHLWTDADGKPFTYSRFRSSVWNPARDAAAAEWIRQHPDADPADCPFVGLTPHDLRSTAATTMIDAGVPLASVAFRLGHDDLGGLVARVYDRGNREARHDADIDRLDEAREAAELVASYQHDGARPSEELDELPRDGSAASGA